MRPAGACCPLLDVLDPLEASLTPRGRLEAGAVPRRLPGGGGLADGEGDALDVVRPVGLVACKEQPGVSRNITVFGRHSQRLNLATCNPALLYELVCGGRKPDVVWYAGSEVQSADTHAQKYLLLLRCTA